MPGAVLGLPALAALEQGIPVIAIRENVNILENDLAALPWGADRSFRADDYREAVGVAAALEAMIDPASERRPLADTSFDVRSQDLESVEPRSLTTT